MGTLTRSFDCPVCGSKGYEFVEYKCGVIRQQCTDCGYYKYVKYKLDENGHYQKIDPSKELDYDNVLVEEESATISFGSFKFYFKEGGGSLVRNVLTAKAYAETLEELMDGKWADVKSVIFSQYVDGSLVEKEVYPL